MNEYSDEKKDFNQQIPINPSDIQQQKQQLDFMMFDNQNFNINQNYFQNQNSFLTKPDIVNNKNLLEYIKEKADEAQQMVDQKQYKSINAKNTFIKKIITLSNKSTENLKFLENSDKIHQKKILKDESVQQLEQDGDKNQIKLARNRESARNSRKRKKIYQELLENKLTELQNFLQQSKMICNGCETQLQNLQNQINYKNELLNTKNILSKNLKAALESNTSERNINSIVESLKNKFGIANDEKMLILDYFFEQISEQILPMHLQYILQAIGDGKDIFSEQQDDKDKNIKDNNNSQIPLNEFPNIIKQLNLNEDQKRKAFKISKQLLKERKKIQQEVNNLFDLKKEMKKELYSLNDTFEQLRKLYDPSQIARFIMQIQMNSNCEQMKKSFQKFFAQTENNNNNDSDEDCDTFYELLKNDDLNNVLLIDINEAYDVFAEAYDFITKKRKMSKEENQ